MVSAKPRLEYAEEQGGNRDDEHGQVDLVSPAPGLAKCSRQNDLCCVSAIEPPPREERQADTSHEKGHPHWPRKSDNESRNEDCQFQDSGDESRNRGRAVFGVECKFQASSLQQGFKLLRPT